MFLCRWGDQDVIPDTAATYAIGLESAKEAVNTTENWLQRIAW
jgi:hypothetical protein